MLPSFDSAVSEEADEIDFTGNEGHDANPATSTIIAPADALKVITCGAVNTAGAIAGFSSSGPTADGRVKPEILACGVSTQTIDNNLASGLNAVSGTSLVSGAAKIAHAGEFELP
jgi:hypothetical protein